MRHLKEFINFDHLDELNITGHWIERTSGENGNPSGSRAVPYSDSTLLGFEIDGFKDENGTLVASKSIEDVIGIDKDKANKFVSFALLSMTTSKELEDWSPENMKEFILLRLGKICFLTPNGKKFCVMMKAGVGKKNTDYKFYPPGDVVWAMVKNFDDAMTFKFYDDSPTGEKQMVYSSQKDSERTFDYFSKHHEFFEIYGEKFEVIIDLSDSVSGKRELSLNDSGIRQKIKDQISGKDVKFGPSQTEFTLPKKEQQMTLFPELTIMMKGSDKEGMVEYEISASKSDPRKADILNRDTMLKDKMIKIKLIKLDSSGNPVMLKKPDGTETIYAISKDIEPGMPLMVKDRSGVYRNARVSQKLYIKDERVYEPIGLLYRFV